MLDAEKKKRLQRITINAIEVSGCVFLAVIIIAVIAHMSLWQVGVVIVAFLSGVGCSFIVTALVAIDAEDDNQREAQNGARS